MAFDPTLLGPRVESYWVELLDRHDQRIDVLDGIVDGRAGASGVLDGSVTYNVDSEIQGGCSLTIQDPGIDWMNTRFRPWVLVNRAKWPLGIYVPASPEEAHSRSGVTVTVSMLDKTSILSATKLTATYSVSTSTSVLGAVQSILTSKLGFDGNTVVITPSSKKPKTALTWPPGTSWLTVVNDLLSSINYNRLWADLMGRLRAEPWIDPATATPSLSFIEGETAIHTADFTVSQDLASVPNRVICTTSGDDKTKAMISVATNTDPKSPYSYAARGNRWVDAFYDNCTATDQKELDTQAHRNLMNNAHPPWYINLSHAVVPIKGRDVARITTDGIDRIAWANEWGISSFKAGTLMTSKWLGVSA